MFPRAGWRPSLSFGEIVKPQQGVGPRRKSGDLWAQCEDPLLLEEENGRRLVVHDPQRLLQQAAPRVHVHFGALALKQLIELRVNPGPRICRLRVGVETEGRFGVIEWIELV